MDFCCPQSWSEMLPVAVSSGQCRDSEQFKMLTVSGCVYSAIERPFVLTTSPRFRKHC